MIVRDVGKHATEEDTDATMERTSAAVVAPMDHEEHRMCTRKDRLPSMLIRYPLLTIKNNC